MEFSINIMRVVFNRLLSIAPHPPSGEESVSRLSIRVGFWINVVLLLFLAAFGAQAFSAEKVTDQQPGRVSINLEPFSSIFIDPESSLELNQINDLNYLFRFAPWQKESLYFTSQKGTAWIKISLPEDVNVKPVPILWLQPPPGVSLNVYISGPKYYKQLPNKRQPNSNIYLYNLTPYADKKLDVFIEIPAAAAGSLLAYLKSPRAFLSDQAFVHWQTGWLLALFIATMIMNAINWFNYHKKAYIFLAGFGLMGSMFLISWQGLFNISELGAGWLQNLMMNASLIVGTILISQIARISLTGNNVNLIYCFNILSIISASLLILALTGTFASLEHSLMINLLTTQVFWYCSLFIRVPGALKIPAWLSTPYAIIHLVTSLAILGVTNHNPIAATWILLQATSINILAFSFYFASQRHLRTESGLSKNPSLSPAPKSQMAKDNDLFNAMGHELRTPLNGVLGMSELLQSTQLTPKQENYVETLRYAGNELSNLINLLSEAWKLEQNEASPDIKPYDINEFLNDCLFKFRLRAEQLNTELISFVHPDVPDISETDTRQLSLILESTLIHIFRHIKNSEVMISVNQTSQLPGSEPKSQQQSKDGYILYQIRYSQGQQVLNLPENTNELSYSEAKRQADISMQLYITIQLIEALSGHFGIMNQGSTHIWFAIPHKEQTTDVIHRDEQPLFYDKNVKALIVDDNKTCRQVLAQQCALMGINTLDAEDGREALAMIRNEAYLGRDFDVIILDHHMPGMNGIQMLERLQEESQIEIPGIIMLTGATNPPGKQRAERLGISRFLTKPAEYKTLQKTLSQVLGERTPSR
ncbi:MULTISPECIES: response regulator [unclassified Endozoicomonas]|uniref:response regulator n=2 Tax=Endozoicomonas TaxID=305899 RepID=UPI003BB633F9